VDGHRVRLVSINGRGEIRWEIVGWQIDDGLRWEKEGISDGDWSENLAAARHFGIIPGRSIDVESNQKAAG
jgi:hypothetical protein